MARLRAVTVVVNNEAPLAQITSPLAGYRYPHLAAAKATVTLAATVSDPDNDAFECKWEERLQHNEHFHTIDEFSTCEPLEVTFDAFGCYTVRLAL